jgi:hypothetical protein
MKPLLIITALLSLTSASALAEFKITRWTMDGGSGQSTGGVHVVTGSLGQPTGGNQSSSSFQLAGGYYGFVAVAPGGPGPVLRITPLAREVVLSWPESARGFLLEQTSSLTRPEWSTVNGVTAVVGGEFQMRLPWTTTNRYFRLRKP